jgi:hypothetical protein
VSDSFVAGLRARAETIRVGSAAAGAITIRVEMPEVWDVVRVVVSADEPVMSVKVSALAALAPDATIPQEFVVKLNGWEVLDESVSLAEAGVVDGSILLLTYRRRRAVR